MRPLPQKANERFGLLPSDIESVIGDKINNGNQIAAERLIEEALLRRFNPSLAGKIFVPSDKFPLIQDAVLSEEPPRKEQRQQIQQVGVLSSASKPSASRHIVTARVGSAITRASPRRLKTHRRPPTLAKN